jgi:hypothetical protein
MRSSAGFWLSVALLCATPAHAEAAFDLDTLLARMASTHGVSAQFHEKRFVALLVEPLESRGVLYFVPPDRMARFTSEPAPASLLVEGESLRFREAPDRPDMDLSGSPVARAFVENFMAVFSGDRERLQRIYRIELSGELERWELALTPRHLPLSRFLEVVLLRGGAEGMREMEIRDADGDHTLTRLEAVQHDRSFDADELDQLFRDGAPLARNP